MVQSSIENIYTDFIGKVSQTRKLDLAKVDELAQGRIWTGAQAAQHQLVDRLGSFSDAIQEARQRVAKLEGQTEASAKDMPFKYAGPKKSAFEKIAQKFIGQIGSTEADQSGLSQWVQLTGLVGSEAVLLQTLGQDLSWLQTVIAKQQPFGAAAHCLCEMTP
jgi:protease-4